MSWPDQKYCLQLALKDLRHNRISTTLIILVIAAICLPLLIVASLREGYIGLLKQSIESSTQAKRIDIAASTIHAQKQYINDSVLVAFKSLSGIEEIVPQKERTVYFLSNKSYNQVDFGAITTIPSDPDLKRYGFSGKFDSSDVNRLGVIVRKADIIKDLGLETVPDSLSLIVTRSVEGNLESFFLPCKVLGTLEGGSARKVYIPVPMANKLERWTLGFAVKEYGLPPAPNREQALGEVTADTCLAISPLKVTGKKTQLLANVGMQIRKLAAAEDYFLYEVYPQNPGEKITEGKRRTIESAMSEDVEVIAIPRVKPIIVSLEGRDIKLMPSLTADPRGKELLRDGVWLNTQRGRFEIMLPLLAQKNLVAANARTRASAKVDTNAAAKSNKVSPVPLPRAVRTIVGPDSVELTIVGTVKDSVGYIDYVVLYRLQQILDNKATYDLKLNAFDVNAKSPYEDRFLIARVHVREIDDIIDVVKYFEEKKYEIYGSNKLQVERLKSTNKILKNLMLLVGLTGGIAGITSLFVLMYEAIKRKRSEIGIMRAMGLSKAFITQIFLNQSLFYGAGGFAIALLLFTGLTFLLDNAVGHAILSLGGLKGSIFKTSIYLTIGFIVAVVTISLIAGRSAAQSARNVDPADILSGN